MTSESSPLARLAPLLLGAALLLAVLLAWPTDAAFFLVNRGTALVDAARPAVTVLLAALGLGALLLPVGAAARTGLCLLDNILLTLGGGAAILSVFILLDGASEGGFANPHMLSGLVWLPAMLGAAKVLVVSCKWPVRVSARRPVAPLTLVESLLLLGIAAVLVADLAAALCPPLLYDVTEYHLGAMADYRWADPGRSGMFVPMAHNWYARFPFPVQSLYYLAMALDPAGGDFAPKLVNLSFVVACALLIYCWLRPMGVARPWRLVAIFAFLAHPVVLDVSLDAFIDAPSGFLVLGALYASLLAGGVFGGGFRPLLIPAAGLLWGAALSSKYTVGQVYLLPMLVVAAWPVVRAAAKERAWPLLAYGVILGAVPLAAWLGKNALWYGNPFEPFFVKWFRPDVAAAIARENYYVESHFPQSFLSADYWRTLPTRLHHFGWVILAPLAAAPLAIRRPSVARMLVVIGLSYLMWNLVRESQNRFLIPSFALVLMVGVASLESLARTGPGPRALAGIAGAAIALLAAGQLGIYALRLSKAGAYEYALTVEPRQSSWMNWSADRARAEYYSQNLGALGDAFDFVNTQAPVTARVLMVYEARPYLVARRTFYNTVFDQSELLRLAAGSSSAEEIVARLRDAGITHVLINRAELRRFIEQYARPADYIRMGLDGPGDLIERFPSLRDAEDYYPPFANDPAWPAMRAPVIEFLRAMQTRATFRAGSPSIEVTVTPLAPAP